MTWTVTMGPGCPGEEERLNQLLIECRLEPMAPHLSATRFLVAKDKGVVVGCGALGPHGAYGFLSCLAVRPTHRGRGLGRHLVRELVDRALRLELKAIYLLTLDKEDFFASLGFCTIDRCDAPESISQDSQFSSSRCQQSLLMSHVFLPPPIAS